MNTRVQYATDRREREIFSLGDEGSEDHKGTNLIPQKQDPKVRETLRESQGAWTRGSVAPAISYSTVLLSSRPQGTTSPEHWSAPAHRVYSNLKVRNDHKVRLGTRPLCHLLILSYQRPVRVLPSRSPESLKELSPPRNPLEAIPQG